MPGRLGLSGSGDPARSGSHRPGRPRQGAAVRQGRRGFQHVPALDGVRALAVLSVMGYHAGVSWLPGGLLGVDVFFVLSGFLITSLLLSEYAKTERISLLSFWGRRARRLLPAMAILLAAMIAWATYLSPATSRGSLRVDSLSTMFYGANWRFITSGQGYFDHFGPQSPLLHTWSVAVEEQFYLVWPLLLLLVVRWRRRGVFTLAFAGAIASAAWMWVLSVDGASTSRLYYGTDTRALPLLLGCTLAALRPPAGIEDSLTRVRKVGGRAHRPDPHPAAGARRHRRSGVLLASRPGPEHLAVPRRVHRRRRFFGGPAAVVHRRPPRPARPHPLAAADPLHRGHLLRAVPLPLAALPLPHPRPYRGQRRRPARPALRGDLRRRGRLLPLHRAADPARGPLARPAAPLAAPAGSRPLPCPSRRCSSSPVSSPDSRSRRRQPPARSPPPGALPNPSPASSHRRRSRRS